LSRKFISVSNCLENLSKNRSISVQSVNKTPNVESGEKVNISSHSNGELILNNPHNSRPEFHDRRRTNSSGSYVQPEKRSRVTEDLNDSIEIIDEVDTEQPIFTCQDCKECFSKQIAINKHVCKNPENKQQKSIPDKGKFISNFDLICHLNHCHLVIFQMFVTGLVDNFDYKNIKNLTSKNVLKVMNLVPHFQHIVTVGQCSWQGRG
jgi:hypothetical protein